MTCEACLSFRSTESGVTNKEGVGGRGQGGGKEERKGKGEGNIDR